MATVEIRVNGLMRATERLKRLVAVDGGTRYSAVYMFV